jgi:transposase
MKAYSLDLRQKILNAYERGIGSQGQVAELFGVSRSFVEKRLRRVRTTGEVKPKPHAGGIPTRVDAPARQHLQEWLREQPDLTLAELTQRLHQRRGIGIGLSRLCGILQELSLPRKKSRSMRRSGTAIESFRRAKPIEPK